MLRKFERESIRAFMNEFQRSLTMAERVVLITGAGQRLGAATATRLMDNGCYVLVHVRSSVDEAERLRGGAHRHGRSCGEVVRADLTVDEQVAT